MTSGTVLDASGVEIEYDAPAAIRAALHGKGKTEDVTFAPDNRRLAITGYDCNSVLMLDIEIAGNGDRPQVRVTDMAEFSLPCFERPHGVRFVDNATIIVANRGGGNMLTLQLESGDGPISAACLILADARLGDGFDLVQQPGSIDVTRDLDGRVELLVCDNTGNAITRHVLSPDPLRLVDSAVLLRRWIDLPDGVAASAEGRCVAMSNHMAHCVMVYDRSSPLHERRDPDAILRGTFCPHGLRFSPDGRHLFVADGARPYVNIYERDGDTWRGVHHSAISLRVMDDETYQRGRRSWHEGGPKGLDIDREGKVLTLTSECQPLAFFDIDATLGRKTDRCTADVLRVKYELDILERTKATEARLARVDWPTKLLKAMPKRLRRLYVKWRNAGKQPATG
jgi:hypothetical protein